MQMMTRQALAIRALSLGFCAMIMAFYPGARAPGDEGEGGRTADNKPPTFTKDVAPIFQEKCEACHRPDSIAPMPLRTYEEARPWARSIRARVEARQMPPWHIDKSVGVQKFKNDMSLTDEQIDTIVSWVDGGALQGDPKDLPKPMPIDTSNEWRAVKDGFGPPDLVVKSEEYTMPVVHQPAEIQSLDTPGGTGTVFNLEDEDGDTTVIWVTPEDNVEGI